MFDTPARSLSFPTTLDDRGTLRPRRGTFAELLRLSPGPLTRPWSRAAGFPTLTPHAIGTAGGPCEILGTLDRDAQDMAG
ncbi:hypothetical protein STENM327S_07206 [Streptomyces tendae]